jgi:integrase
MTNNVNLSKSRRTRRNGDGTVYPIKNRNRWGASIHNYLGDRVSKSFETKDEAFAWLLEQKRARSQGLFTEPEDSKTTVSEYLLDWVEHNKNHKKPSTTRNYLERIRNQINPHIGHIKASALTPKAIEHLVSELITSGYKPGTVLGVFRTLSAAYSDGYRLGTFQHDPTKRVKLPKLKSTPMKQIPREDAAKIYMEAVKNPYNHARIEIGMVCGLRPGEVFGLLWSDVDWDSRTLNIARQVQRVKNKGLVFQSVKQDKARVIVLTDEQVKILKSHRDLQNVYRPTFKSDEGLIFPNSIGGKMDDRGDALRWKRLLKSAGVQHYQRYQMRKTAFSNLYAQLGDVRQLLDYSGHSQVSTIMNSYVFATEESASAIRKSLDAVRPSQLNRLMINKESE